MTASRLAALLDQATPDESELFHYWLLRLIDLNAGAA